MSNGIIFFFCPMFIDELFNSAKLVSMLLSVRNSQYKAQDKVYVTLNKAVEPFWCFCENKQKQLNISCNTRDPKQLCRRLEAGLSHRKGRNPPELRQMC